MPLTATSRIVSVTTGLFYAPKYGFQISSQKTDWLHISSEKKVNSFIITEYRSPRIEQGVQAALTVRVDPFKKASTLKSYMKKWINDYPRFGFKVLKTKPIKVENQLGFLIDVFNPKSQRQIRQVVFKKDQQAIILTCRFHRETQSKNISDCNKIIRNFKWSI